MSGLKISEQVENILRVSHAARNSDRELLILYMAKFGMGLTKEQEDKFRKMPSTETIRRTRQALQEQGKYPADKEVDEARFQKYRKMRYEYKYNDDTNTVERILT